MKNDELLSQISLYASKVNGFYVCLGKLSKADDVIGYYFDELEEVFRVYINYERGEHHIRKSTVSETEALEKVLAMLKCETER